MCTFAGYSVRNEKECLKSIECRMKESELATFFKGWLDFIYYIS